MKKAVWGAFLLMTTLAVAGLCEMDYTLSNPHIRYEKIEGARQEEAAQADGAGISLSDMAAAEDAQSAAQSADTWPKTFTVTLGGDTTLGSTDDLRKREDCFENVAADKGYGWFFSGLQTLFATDDLTLVNFEGTLTEETSKKEKLYNFKGPAEYTDILTLGSVEAVKASLEKLSNEEVRVRVIHGGVGAINESDVMLASTSQAIIVGFNVRPDSAARESAARQNVDMRMYRVIYDAIDEIETAMKGMLAPKYREVVLGHAEVRGTYKVSSVGTVAGCYVQDGKLQRKDCQVRLVRDGIVIHEGVLASLQRFKDSVKEVKERFECGLTVEKFNDIKLGDIIEGYTMEEIPR